jgi:hypothetical protein
MRLLLPLSTLTFFLLFSSARALAYPNAISHGYTSCLTCHYNSWGNGPLTDYGRAVSATVYAAKPFFLPGVTDEQLSASSGFLGSKELPNWIRPSIDYRGMDYRTGVGQANSIDRFIHMQADANVVIKTDDDRIWASITAGYIPVPAALQSSSRASNISTWISREHYVASRIGKRFFVYGGLTDVAFGLKLPDHNSYIRARTGLNQNDQSHGVLVHWAEKKFDASVHLLAGNFFQDAALRQEGVSIMGEYDVAKDLRAGASVLYTTGKFRTRQMNAIHARLGFGDGDSLLTQIGTVREDPITQEAQTGVAFFTQSTTQLVRGLNLLFTFEYYTRAVGEVASRSYRAGPSLQYFPMQRLELRTDLQGTRTIGGNSLEQDNYALFTQIHVWL